MAKKSIRKGRVERGAPTPEAEVSVEQCDASAFLAAAEEHVRRSILALMKLGKDGVLEAEGVQRVYAELDQADADARALIDLIKKNDVKLDVRKFIHSYNRFITWVGNKTPRAREELKPIDLSFFGLTEESFENSGVAGVEGDDPNAGEHKNKQSEGELVASKAVEGSSIGSQLDRLSSDLQELKDAIGYAQLALAPGDSGGFAEGVDDTDVPLVNSGAKTTGETTPVPVPEQDPSSESLVEEAAVASSDTSAPGPDVAEDKREERLEMPEEDLPKDGTDAPLGDSEAKKTGEIIPDAPVIVSRAERFVVPDGQRLRNGSRPLRKVQKEAPFRHPFSEELVLDSRGGLILKKDSRDVQQSSPDSPPVDKKSFFDRMRNWARPITDSDIYRVHMKGEKTRAEMGEPISTLSRGAMITGAVLSGALSYFGAAFPLDGIRYLGQRFYVGNERDEISAAFRAALEERRKRELEPRENEAVYVRSNKLRNRILDSRYLTETQKDELITKLEIQKNTFAGRTSDDDEHLSREVGRILENAIRTRITGEKVVKEALNTTLVVAASPLFLVAGANFLRAPAYGAVSLYERWNRLTREAPESKAGERLRATVSDGFTEYWDQVQGKKGYLGQVAALGTAARFVGMSATLVESVAASDFIGDLLHAWESKEAAYSADIPDLSGLGIDEVSKHITDESASSAGLPEVEASPEGEHVEVPEPSLDTLLDEVSPDVEPVPEADGVVMSPERIPNEAIVTRGDGITQTLLSAVEARPDLLDTFERGALGDDHTAALLMRSMAVRDGLLNYWISEEAIGELAIVPVYDTQGVPHITFLNPDTGTAYSVDELKDLGWLVKAPR